MTKTKFGPQQIVKGNTPLWAKWIFRTVFLLTTAAIGWIAATNMIAEPTKYEITIFLKLFVDPIAYGLSKMFGVEEISNYEYLNRDK